MDELAGTSTPVSRRQRVHQLKRARIAQAAAALFHAQGFAATTTDQIAAKADVAKGTLFLYAPTKARLLVLMFETHLEAAVGEAFTEVATGAPPVETLLVIFGRLFRVYERDLDLSRRFVQEALFLTPEEPPYSAALDVFFARLVELIAGWQANGRVIATADARLIAQTTFALYFSALAGWLGGRLPDTTARDQLLAAALALHFRGLLTNV